MSAQGARWCPECGTEYGPGIVACPRCRAVLEDEPPAGADAPVVVHAVPDEAAGALLMGVLEGQGLHAVLRSATLPGYGSVRRDWATSAWGEILVPRNEAEEARVVLAEYLLDLERGGAVRDEDVEPGPDEPR
jgi:hypothetical protein